MSRWETPSGTWSRLDSLRSGFLSRCERYAALTIPKVCLPAGYDVVSQDQTHDYQSLGAEAVNNVVNKLMIAVFPNGHTFFRMKVDRELRKQLAAQGMTEDVIDQVLAEGERDAVTELESSGQRPKLYQLMRHLVITGNVAIDTFSHKDHIKVIGIRNFVVSRTGDGKLKTLVIREKLLFGELTAKVQEALPGRFDEDTEVSHYKRIRRLRNGDYVLDQAIDEVALPNDRFGGKWTEETLPFDVLTWDLDDESDYATSLVEEHVADFEALSVLAEGTVDGSVMAAEVRYGVNPAGMTTADDMNKSENGDFLPARPDDIAAITADNYNGVKVAFDVMSRWEQRIARNFLMGSAITRDAERVTAEEIRMNAKELESAYGGRYSALGATLQPRIANWLLDRLKFSIKGTKIKVVIITGLEALSRNADVQNVKMALTDLAAVAALPESLQKRVKFEPLAAFIGRGYGTDLSPFIMNDEEYKAVLDEEQSRMAAQEAAAAGAQAGAQIGAQGAMTQ